MVYVFKQSGANVIDVSDRVRKVLADLNEEMTDPADERARRFGRLHPAVDPATFANRPSKGMVLTMLVLLLFLGSMRSTIIIGITMPLSVFCTFILIYYQGYTLNMVSFGGLALGIGMLVDNSIVVLESIFCYRDAGLSPKEAAIKGTDEVAMAIVASTLTIDHRLRADPVHEGEFRRSCSVSWRSW